MNCVFISYAGENHHIAKKLEGEINNELKSSFHAELVEDRKEGDTTFTEKVIEYFKKCNVFIVLLTKESKEHQWVNQEWGYAKCLKELGQIQLLLHITEKSNNGKRIESKGFISTNMDFIDLEMDTTNKPKIEKMISEVIRFLKDKEKELIPKLLEVQQKLNRFSNEIDRNINLKNELIEGEKSFREKGSMNPLKFQLDYALQLLQIGHFFPISFIEKIEEYVDKIKEINIWKDLAKNWAISRRTIHTSDTDRFYKLLRDSNNIMNKMKEEVQEQILNYRD